MGEDRAQRRRRRKAERRRRHAAQRRLRRRGCKPQSFPILHESFDSFDPVVTCWCGVRGKYSDLHDEDSLDQTCGGMGTLHCYCGGDFCVCHNHGEVECHGCVDCRDYNDDEQDGPIEEPDFQDEIPSEEYDG